MGGYFLEYNNFLPGDSLKTPLHIAPTWYFTPFYSVLRATTADFMYVLMGVATGCLRRVFIWLKSQPVDDGIKMLPSPCIGHRRHHRHAAAGAGREILGRGVLRRFRRDPGLPAMARPFPREIDPLPSELAQICVRHLRPRRS